MSRRMFWLPVLLLTSGAFAYAEDTLAKQAYGILQKNCITCHGIAKASGLDLRTRESLLAGGTRGPAVKPFDADKSLILRLVSHEETPAMPPGTSLTAADVATLRRWVATGALFEEAESNTAAAERRKAEMAKLEERPITPEERQFWAYRQPVRSDPAVKRRNPIDGFLAAAMAQKHLKPSPPADRRTLIRRAYLDLLGLPPEPAEVEVFVNDRSPNAWERVVEKLLASPHYGERWGRHWLDLVRFADSGGFERDFDWPNAWRYRDYVVKAFNDDKPYDRFVREQLAGDEFYPGPDEAGSEEAMIATGYLRLGMDNNIKDERTRMDELDDLVATTSLSFLGMTVGCARCHNHKFDPIPQRDYYRLQAVFFSTRGYEYPLVGPDELAAHKSEMSRIDRLEAPLKSEKRTLEEPYRRRLFEEGLKALPEYMRIAWQTPADKRTEGQKLNAHQIERTLVFADEKIRPILTAEDREKVSQIDAKIKELDKQRPKPYPTARAIKEDSREAMPSYFLYRGSPDARGSLMGPGTLSVATKGEYTFPQPPENVQSSWRRHGLADWIASADNPLTARVMVNRIWQQHFGEGIVRTPSNFGKTGERPSHPELLDWLATEFVSRGWSVKAMHRLMMTSDAYQMASDDIESNLKVDPDNRSFWRMGRQRLPAEIVRDLALAVSGSLNRTVGGPAVFPYINPDLFQSSTSRTWPGKPDDDPSTWRRSVYVFSKRSIRYPMFELFDQPDMVSSCARRNQSTIATQALLLMNNAFIIQEAKAFAKRLRAEAGEDAGAQVDRAYVLALARHPSRFEREKAVEFIGAGPRGLDDFCQAVFSFNEFVYRQ
jgi:mono/diheme cytochrome c family protein